MDWFIDLTIPETAQDYYDADFYGIGRSQDEIDAEYEEFLNETSQTALTKNSRDTTIYVSAISNAHVPHLEFLCSFLRVRLLFFQKGINNMLEDLNEVSELLTDLARVMEKYKDKLTVQQVVCVCLSFAMAALSAAGATDAVAQEMITTLINFPDTPPAQS